MVCHAIDFEVSFFAEPRKDTITYIPGVPAIEPHELMSYLQETDATSVVHRIIFKAFEQARGADYVLCNTVEELEPSTIAALRSEKPFYAVGPIGFPRGGAGGGDRGDREGELREISREK